MAWALLFLWRAPQRTVGLPLVNPIMRTLLSPDLAVETNLFRDI
jgi:hypothetical protein